jgi:hypothetical protein
MRVPEEPVCINLFRKNPVFTSLLLKSPVHVVTPQESQEYNKEGERNVTGKGPSMSKN